MIEIKIDKLIRSKRKSIGLQIAPDATLIVRAPYFVTLQELQHVVLNKHDWIISKQAMVRSRLAKQKKIELIAGACLLYLGNLCRLEFIPEQKNVFLEGHRIYVKDGEASQIRKLLITWYKEEAQRILSERVGFIARRSGIEYKSVAISRAKRRWGSCGPSGELNFNWRLIMTPPFVLDYVVVHELAHIKIRNHSRYFWNTVSSMMPDYKKSEHWLKENHGELDI